MSYVLFSQTSTANGTRNMWAGATAGSSSTGGAAVVNGALVAGVANSTFDETALVNGLVGWASGETYLDGQLLMTNDSSALYDLSAAGAGSTDASFNAALEAALDASGNVLTATAAFTGDDTANNRTLDDASGYSVVSGRQTLNLGLADINWNDIKNVEVRIDSVDTGDGYDAVVLRSFVDARIRIGDSTGCIDAREASSTRFTVDIVNGKRGQIDASRSDMAVDATIDVWTNNSGWQNSFSNSGSGFSDTFTINFGDLAVRRSLSEFGVGAGRLVDANDTNFGTDADQASAYNGQLTTLFTNMGAGDDRYVATKGVSVVSNGAGGTMIVDAELQTVDYVWGGSGDDVILAGGGNDVLFGDFGGSGGVAQSGDPAALGLKLGAAADGFANWAVAGLVKEIWQQNLGGPKLTATAANWDQQFRLEQGYAIGSISGGVGVGSQTGTSTSNGATAVNPEINTGTTGADNATADDDVLGFSFLSALSGAKVGFGLFYADEGVERAIVRLTSGGVEVATYRVSANGTVAFLTGTDAFTLSLTGGGDTWNNSNPGESTLDIAAKSDATFDGMEFRSGGNNGVNEVSDFYLTDLCVTAAATEGDDTIEGGGDNGRLSTANAASATVTIGDDITGGGGEDTIIWALGDGLDVVRDFDVNADQLRFNEGGARTLTALTFGGVESTLVRTSDGATDGVILQGVKTTDLGAGDILIRQVVDFDDIDLNGADDLDGGVPGERTMPAGYDGFQWKQAGVFAPPGAGYTATSGANIGFIAEALNSSQSLTGYPEAAGSPVVIERATDFDFLSGNFSAAFRNGLAITVEAFDDGEKVGEVVVVANQNAAPVTLFADASGAGRFRSIDELRFNANDGNDGTNDYFGFDDLVFLV